VTSSFTPDDVTPEAVTGATHYYTSVPAPAPVYVIINDTGGIYPALSSAAVGAGSVLTTSGYVTPMMLPPGMIPAAAAAHPSLLRPGLIQQPPPASVIVPSGLLPASILPTHPAPTSVMPSHGAVLPLAPAGDSEVPVTAVSELSLSAGYSFAGAATQPVGTQPVGSMQVGSQPVSTQTVGTQLVGAMQVGMESAEHECGYVLNVNNSATQPTVQPHTIDTVNDTLEPELEPVEKSLHGNSHAAQHEECSQSDDRLELESPSTAAVDCNPVTVNGELSVHASHDLGSSSETSSVMSPNSLQADVSLTDSANVHDTALTNHHSPQQPSATPPPTVTEPSPSTTAAAKTKVSSWASLLKNTTSATNAIVINMNDGHAVATQQKTDVKAVNKEATTPQSAVSRVSNNDKLKLEISGLYTTVPLLNVSFVLDCT